MTPYTPEILSKARGVFESTGSWDEAALAVEPDVGKRLLGNTLRSAVRRAEARGELAPEPAVRVESSGGGFSASIPAGASFDEMVERLGVDLSQWRVTRWTGGGWGGPDADEHGHVRLWFEPIEPELDREVAEELVEFMAQHAPRYEPLPPPPPGADHVLEVALFDVHLGMRAWAEETGTHYDHEEARRIVRGAIATTIARAKPYGVGEILLPIGGDWLHVDRPLGTSGGSTQRGTPQDTSAHVRMIWRLATEALIEVIDLLRLEAPVTVVIVPGNHDQESLFHLGDVVRAHYRLDDRVTVNNDPSSRRYLLRGEVLLGYAHGDEEKGSDLPLLMATEAPELWAAAKIREWHIGHYHRKQERQAIAVDERGGVRIRVMPSLAGRDAWHARQGYLHQRTTESLIWHPRRGLAGLVSVGAEEAKEAA